VWRQEYETDGLHRSGVCWISFWNAFKYSSCLLRQHCNYWNWFLVGNTMKSRWQTFKDFILSKEEGYIFTRKELIQVLHYEQESKEQWSGVPRSTISICVKNLLMAGFLKRAGRGKYELLSSPPKELTVNDCFLIASGDNLTYVERLHNRKERQKKKLVKLK
jgi:hypothetical protein